MTDESEVFDRALALTEPRRAELARRLLDSLDPIEKDSDYDEAWTAEIERRANDADGGRGLLSREEFEARLDRALVKARSAQGVSVTKLS